VIAVARAGLVRTSKRYREIARMIKEIRKKPYEIRSHHIVENVLKTILMENDIYISLSDIQLLKIEESEEYTIKRIRIKIYLNTVMIEIDVYSNGQILATVSPIAENICECRCK
jgi:hypothetical protein